MTFSSNILVPKQGELYCHVFENEHLGVARSLFWTIAVEYEPMKYGGEDFMCGLTCEWIRWPVRRWLDLNGATLDFKYGQDGMEASFYLAQHDPATHTHIELHHRHANLFSLKLNMLVDFHGYFGGDENPDLPVRAEIDVPFTGLLVVPNNLFPIPSTLSEFKSIAANFVDLSVYQEPEPFKDHGIIFRPAEA